jgi:cation:H+ antiporter
MMLMPIVAILLGLLLLVWSADKFVDGASATARYLGMPSLLIGMIIVGFGTSAPEMAVSALSALDGSPGIALGNAYGSNITNIALILGVTAMIAPVAVNSLVLRKELPILTAITLLSALLVADGQLTRMDGYLLMALFVGLVVWSVREGLRNKGDALEVETEKELQAHSMTMARALTYTGIGLVVMIAASRALVWGAVNIAEGLGVSDMVIGLTVVAVGTSLPEFASSIVAIRKGEDDIALGNILGSNMFNALAVVGIATLIKPMTVGPEVLQRDMLVMTLVTVSLFVFGYGFRNRLGRINRIEGALLLASFIAYTAYLIVTAT